MAEKKEKWLAVLDGMARPGNRSSLFWWMFEHHDEIVEATAGQRMQWKRLCVEFVAMGLTDTSGRGVTEANARKTWWQARREKARRAAARAADEAKRDAAAEARRNYPSRMPRDVRPLAGEPARHSNGAVVVSATARASPSALPIAAAKPWEDPKLPPERARHMQEQLERLDREHEWNARHVKPLSKERYKELEQEFGVERVQQRLLLNRAREEG
ncbi:hypothetical protein [Methylocystis sp.]|uniref:hypothetical protein n=1 Tax=Methylocystis sp. TaxID=1911079 RepID=UPI0025E270FC|nr:hypothetical protein [Methylocystis sp.]